MNKATAKLEIFTDKTLPGKFFRSSLITEFIEWLYKHGFVFEFECNAKQGNPPKSEFMKEHNEIRNELKRDMDGRILNYLDIMMQLIDKHKEDKK